MVVAETILETAKRYAAAGLAVIPVRADGSKAAAVKWAEFEERAPSAEELEGWFTADRAVGLALVCGKVSGNLAVLDFESNAAWEKWHARLTACGLLAWIAGCPLVKSPKGGRHLYCRIEEGWVAGGKLAMASKNETVIEVRGQGHYVLAPGRPAACHPLNIPYESLAEGWIAPDAPFGTVTVEQFTTLCDLAREQNEYVPPERVRVAAPAPSDAKGERPGDYYNRRASWAELLEPHGWSVDHTSGAVTYWTRPGKDRGVSATTGRCRSEGGGDLLYVFSSNAAPFEAQTAYDKFGAAAQLEHGGDFSAAAKALHASGYGKAVEPAPVVTWTASPGANDGSGRGFKWASELTAPPKADDWIWEGYLPRGAVALMSALWKAGKTTLLSHLLRACGRGGEFLGKPLKAYRVLYVSEEGERHWVRRRDSLAIGDHVGFYLQPFATRPAQAGWQAFVNRLKADVQAHKFDLVVFDTLAKLWPVQEENDAGAVDAALMPLWEVTRSGAGVLLIHHLRKSGGQEYTGSRGSGALSAFPDILIELTRFDAADAKDRKRVIRAKGRYEETPDELVIELVNGEYVQVPDVQLGTAPAAVDQQSSEEARLLRILAESADPWMQTEEIREAVRLSGPGIRNEDVATHLASMYQRKQVVMCGRIRSKTDPRKFALASRIHLVPPLGLARERDPGTTSDGHDNVSFQDVVPARDPGAERDGARHEEADEIDMDEADVFPGIDAA